jgi:hypothetical protein
VRAALAVIAVAACASSPDAPATCSEPSPALAGSGSATADDVRAIVVARCALGGCHLSAPGAGDLVLAGSDWPARVVGVPSHEVPSLDLVSPGDPADSWLARKIVGDLCADGGIQMPFGAALPDADQHTIIAWIAAGAPD